MTRQYIIKDFINDFCIKFEVTLEQLQGKSRKLEINYTRKLLIFMLRRVFKLKHRDVGSYLNRDHSTSIHHTADFDSLKDVYALFKEMYQSAIEISLKHLDKLNKIKSQESPS